MTTYFWDPINGNDGNNGQSFANRKKLLSAFSLSAGDIVKCIQSPSQTSLSQNLTWTHLSSTVTLSSAVTTTISDAQTTWTAGTGNVTCSDNTSTFKNGTKSQSIAINGSFTTGKAAYFATGTLDLSTRRQVSFHIQQTAGTVAVAGDISIRLCSDTSGVTTVNTINIPGLVVLNQWTTLTIDTGGALGASIQSVALYVDTDEGAQTFLLSQIIACKDSTSADSLTLTSLLGHPDSTGAGGLDNDSWYAIQSISGTTIKLDNWNFTTAGNERGWTSYGRAIESSTNASPIVITSTNHGLITGDTIELRNHLVNTGANGTFTVTKVNANTFSLNSSTGNGVGGATGYFWNTAMIRNGHKRETLKRTMVSGNNTTIDSVPNSGSAGSNITISGGWNSTDMSTQNSGDETWLSGGNCQGIGLIINVTDITLSKIAISRYFQPFQLGSSSARITLTTPGTMNCASNWTFNATTGHVITVTCSNNNGNSTFITASLCTNSTITVGQISNNGATPITGLGNGNRLTVGSANNNSGNGVSNVSFMASFDIKVALSNTSTGVTFTSHNGYNRRLMTIGLSALNVNGVSFGGGSNIVKMSTYGNSTQSISHVNAVGPQYLVDSYLAESTKFSAWTAFNDVLFYAKNYLGVAGSYAIIGEGFTAQTETTIVHTAGTSWKINISSSTRISTFRASIPLARIPVESSKTYIIKCYIRRDNVADFNAGLRVYGGLITGVPSDLTVTASGALNTWAEETLTSFTPTEAGVIELYGEAWYGSTSNVNAYFDDITVNDGTKTYSINLDVSDWRFGPGRSVPNYPAVTDVRTSTTYGQDFTGTLTLPGVSTVLSTTSFGSGGTEFTGTYVVVATTNVRNGTTFGALSAQTGTLTLPSVGNVLSSASFGAGGNEFTGTYVVTATTNVRSGITFGALSAQTGTLALPATSTVLSTTSFGAGGNEFTGTYVVTAVTNVRNGITFGASSGQTGTLTLPAIAAVLATTSFGAGGNEFTGTVTLPAIEDVLNSANFGADGQFTGTYVATSEADVRDGITFGDSNEQTGTLLLPSVGDVLNTTSFGSDGTEFTGTYMVVEADDVLEGVDFGADGIEFTGTYVIVTEANVRDGVTFGPSNGQTGNLEVSGDGSTSTFLVRGWTGKYKNHFLSE